jgi:hypothetical protein
VIDATGAGYSLTLNTGAAAISNSGLIEASTGATATIDSEVLNAGTLKADGGTLVAQGGVRGAGSATINGGKLDVVGAFAETVTFSGATGILELANGQTFTGKVAGLSLAGTNAIDLDDIAFTQGVTTASFSGSATSGTLTVTDGAHTAKINLIGDYTKSTFVVSADGHGGTTVHDPSVKPIKPKSSTTGIGALVQAAAAFNGHAPACTSAVYAVKRGPSLTLVTLPGRCA